MMLGYRLFWPQEPKCVLFEKLSFWMYLTMLLLCAKGCFEVWPTGSTVCERMFNQKVFIKTGNTLLNVCLFWVLTTNKVSGWLRLVTQLFSWHRLCIFILSLEAKQVSFVPLNLQMPALPWALDWHYSASQNGTTACLKSSWTSTNLLWKNIGEVGLIFFFRASAQQPTFAIPLWVLNCCWSRTNSGAPGSGVDDSLSEVLPFGSFWVNVSMQHWWVYETCEQGHNIPLVLILSLRELEGATGMTQNKHDKHMMSFSHNVLRPGKRFFLNVCVSKVSTTEKGTGGVWMSVIERILM